MKEQMEKIKEMFNLFRLFRLHSKYYPQIAFFGLFSVIILYYCAYLGIHHDTLSEIYSLIALVLFVIVFVVLPLGTIYYCVKFCISLQQISKKQYDKTYTNKVIWISYLIYIFLILYTNIINYFPNLNIIRIL